MRGKFMVAIALTCPFCGSEDVRSYGTANGKKRYACNNPACSHKTFYAQYSYNDKLAFYEIVRYDLFMARIL
jgi:transposase-like protein